MKLSAKQSFDVTKHIKSNILSTYSYIYIYIYIYSDYLFKLLFISRKKLNVGLL